MNEKERPNAVKEKILEMKLLQRKLDLRSGAKKIPISSSQLVSTRETSSSL
jgi:hypothetical protein